MNRSLLKTQNLVLKSLALSFLGHVAVLSLFIFTFPVKPPAFKPNFIFLGSLLNNYPAANKPIGKNTHQTLFSPNKFTKDNHNLKKNPYNITFRNKPRVLDNFIKSSKETEKFYFHIDYPAKSDKLKQRQDIFSKFDQLDYIPLKLDKREGLTD